MNKPQLLRITNTILFFSFLIQGVTGLIIFFHIKTPHVQAVFEIHQYNGLLMIVATSIHVILNWGWIRANYFRKVMPAASNK